MKKKQIIAVLIIMQLSLLAQYSVSAIGYNHSESDAVWTVIAEFCHDLNSGAIKAAETSNSNLSAWGKKDDP